MTRFFFYSLDADKPTTVRDTLYQSGTINVFDNDSDSPYPVKQGSYRVPIDIAHKFQDFIESLETEMPLMVSVGDVEQCDQAACVRLTTDSEGLDARFMAEYDDEEEAAIEDYMRAHGGFIDED